MNTTRPRSSSTDINQRPCILSFVCVLALLLFSGCAAPQSIRQPRESAPVNSFSSSKAVETFDAAWKIIHETHFDTNFNGVNWLALKEELRPKAAAAISNTELREIIEDMLGRLGHSHMSLIPGDVASALDQPKSDRGKASEQKRGSKASKTRPPPAANAEADEPEPASSSRNREGDFGLEIRIIDHQVIVFRVDPGGPADAAGVKPGWLLLQLDGRSFTNLFTKETAPDLAKRVQFMAWASVTGLLTDEPETVVKAEFLNGANQVVGLELKSRQNRGMPAKLGNLPTLYSRLDHRWLRPGSEVGTGMIHFNIWMFPIAAAFDRAIEEFQGAQGIIIDLRGNLGGVGGMIMGIAGHFLDQSVSLGTFKTRDSELRLFSNPRRVSASGKRVTPYAGPVAILTDAISLSAAEVFAGGMQDIKRARVFGETSGGQALPALFDRLPNGDVLYHAFADFTTPSGHRLEHVGVVPDEPVTLTRRDLLEGRDPVIAAAVRWINSKAAPAKSAR